MGSSLLAGIDPGPLALWASVVAGGDSASRIATVEPHSRVRAVHTGAARSANGLDAWCRWRHWCRNRRNAGGHWCATLFNSFSSASPTAPGDQGGGAV
jgi:hypothetical protein